MLSTSVIIPTYNRPDDLEIALSSILEQTQKPTEVVIIDDGSLGDMPFRKELEELGVQCVYRKKDSPGLTKSRNLGVSVASGDVVLFFDDDVKLMPDYIEKIMEAYEADQDKEVGAVGGLILNHKPLSFVQKLRVFYNALFLVSGFTEGKVLKSGFCTNYGSSIFPPKTLAQVDFLAGCAFSFRKEVFEKLSFSDKYKGYGLGEDKDFSYAVAKYFKVSIQPEAKLYHYESPLMRVELNSLGYQFILGRYFFFKDHVYHSWWQWPLFWYAVTGYTFFRVLIMLFSKKEDEKERVKGIFKAIGNILRRRIDL